MNLVQVGFDDAKREWSGATAANQLPDPSEWAEMLLVGGLGEARFAANVYDAAQWQIDSAATVQAIMAAFNAPQNPLAQVGVRFVDPNNATKTFEFQREIFSDDWAAANQLAGQHGLATNNLLGSAIQWVNEPTVWNEIIEVARILLLRSPRQLIWRFDNDDELPAKYRIGPIEDKVKERLKGIRRS